MRFENRITPVAKLARRALDQPPLRIGHLRTSATVRRQSASANGSAGVTMIATLLSILPLGRRVWIRCQARATWRASVLVCRRTSWRISTAQHGVGQVQIAARFSRSNRRRLTSSPPTCRKLPGSGVPAPPASKRSDRSTHPASLSQLHVALDVVAQAFYAIVADDEPQLQGAETPAQLTCNRDSRSPPDSVALLRRYSGNTLSVLIKAARSAT
jgi:hypothetical protein